MVDHLDHGSLHGLDIEGEDAEHAEAHARLRTRVMAGRADERIGVLHAAVEHGLEPTVVYAEVLVAAQKEIGELWHVGDINIAEERLVSEATRDLMTRLSATLTRRSLVAEAEPDVNACDAPLVCGAAKEEGGISSDAYP